MKRRRNCGVDRCIPQKWGGWCVIEPHILGRRTYLTNCLLFLRCINGNCKRSISVIMKFFCFNTTLNVNGETVLEVRVSVPDRCWEGILICLTLRLDRLCGPLSLISIGYWCSFPGGKPGPGRDAEVNNAWCYTSTPLWFFMAWCLVNHRDNLRFTF
jgi:hypothetical protein